MVAMEATLSAKNFKDVRLEPKAVTSYVLIRLAMVPILTFAMNKVFGSAGPLAMTSAIIASIPGGTVSNIFTHFAKSNAPLSISTIAWRRWRAC